MLQNLLVTAMVASYSIFDRRKFWRYFLTMRFPSQSNMLFSFDEYALSSEFYLLVISRYTSSESVMSSYVGLEVRKYKKKPYN